MVMKTLESSGLIVGGKVVEEPIDETHICVTCGSKYAEYVNGCPHCWNAGIRSSVHPAPKPDPSPKLRAAAEQVMREWDHHTSIGFLVGSMEALRDALGHSKL